MALLALSELAVGSIETKHDGRVIGGEDSSSRLNVAVGWDGVSTDTLVSTVTVSVDGELLAESTTQTAVSVWNSVVAPVGGDFDGDTASVAATSRSIIPVMLCSRYMELGYGNI